jgi:hypothetical protein
MEIRNGKHQQRGSANGANRRTSGRRTVGRIIPGAYLARGITAGATAATVPATAATPPDTPETGEHPMDATQTHRRTGTLAMSGRKAIWTEGTGWLPVLTAALTREHDKWVRTTVSPAATPGWLDRYAYRLQPRWIGCPATEAATRQPGRRDSGPQLTTTSGYHAYTTDRPRHGSELELARSDDRQAINSYGDRNNGGTRKVHKHNPTTPWMRIV